MLHALKSCLAPALQGFNIICVTDTMLQHALAAQVCHKLHFIPSHRLAQSRLMRAALPAHPLQASEA